MQITTRASVLAVTLLASSPLLAAGSGTFMADADVSTQETLTMTEQDDCWLSTLPSTDASENLAGFLPKPGSPADSAGVDRDLSETCRHPLSLGNDDPEGGASPKRGYSGTALPTRIAGPDLGSVFFWRAYLMQTVFLKPGMHF